MLSCPGVETHEAMTWTQPGFEAVATLVGQRTGLSFPARMRPAVEERIRRAMRERSVPDVFRYRDVLASNAPAFDALVADLTVGETYFFREPEQMEYIRAQVLPDLVRAGPPGSGLRVWSAGCASGEETYSLAILLRDAGLERGASILGTDISRERLARARRARYSKWSLRGVPEAVVRRDFRRQGNHYQLRPELREAVKYRQLNLADESFPSVASGVWGMDLILCRNVLIYLEPWAVAGVARRLMQSLSARGWLFLGASDPPLTDLVECEVVITGAGIAYRRGAPGRRAPVDRVAAFRAYATPVAEPAPRRVPDRDPPPVGEEEGAPAALDPEEVGSLYARREYSRASERARVHLERAPSEPALWILLVRSLANQGNLAEAGRACSAALEHCRTNAELMHLQALLLSSAGHLAEAVAAERRALYLDRRFIMAHLSLGTLLLRSGEGEAARAALRAAERLLAASPPDAVVPASDGETAGKLLASVRRQLRLTTSTE